jgi:membrane protein YqaA with SNARE-associated domain
LLKPFQELIDRTAGFIHRSTSRADAMSGKKRVFIALLILVAMCALGYGTYEASFYLEGFEQYGALGAFLASFVASTSIFFPVFGFVVVGAIAASDASNWALVALGSAFGSALGQFTAYLAGYGGRAVIRREQSIWYRRAEDWMNRYGSLGIFFFALTFLPVDVAGLVAGALRFPYWKYLMATFIGYMPKTFIGCYLAHTVWHRWPSLEEMLGGIYWWGWVLIAAGVALIIAGIVIVWLRRRKANRKADGEVQG